MVHGTMKSENSFGYQELRKGILEGEFVLHYQPRMDTKSGTVVGAEALVRWSHPKLGLLSPSTFISVAEQTNAIISLGEWVLRTACKQTKAWQDAGLPPVLTSVNVSAVQFKYSDVVSLLQRVLAETQLDAKWIEIEITETTLMDLDDHMASIIEELRDVGVHVSIDDFGTGYSSLTYLKKFSVSALKIDRQFIQDIPSSFNSVAISKAVIALAHTLNLRVVAEGVETDEQLKFLFENQCDEVQGFLHGEPVAAETFARLFLPRNHASPPVCD